ncbi:efflux RND transporter periplasmic adaptor subunit [Magnetococcus sp. PR-3]|uniref:efflux RND transporter periplasmic adaptor subunit n=1 Tax=Magnetococcus sp. PR-3 TaxID=3120355 RepID=UPI002FCE66B0
MNRFKALQTLLFPLLILAGGAMAIRYIGTMDPLPATPVSMQARPNIQVQAIQPAWHAPKMTLTGEVYPSRQLRLMPRIAGRVVEVHPNLILGGTVKKGALLVRLEDQEAKRHIKLLASRARTAELELEIEAGRQKLAKQDWAVLRRGDSKQASDLALRLPHLGVARQKLATARIEHEQAKREHRYTLLFAPFDALVVSKDVAMGQWLVAGQEIARLIASDHFLVHLSMAQPQFSLLNHKKIQQGKGPKLFLRPSTNMQVPATVAQLTGVLGELQTTTRRLTLLAKLDNPMMSRGLPLLPGSFVHAQLTGSPQPHIYAIPTQATEDGNRIWTVQNQALKSYTIEPMWEDQGVLYVRIPQSDQRHLNLVVSPLSLPVDGQPVTLTEQQPRTKPSGAK